jgi:hypothetical protein
MGMGDIFDEGFDLYKKNLSFFLLISAMILVPGLIIQQAIRSISGSGGVLTPPPSDPGQYPDWLWTYLSAHSPLISSEAVYVLLTAGALIVATSSRYIGQSISIVGVFLLLLCRGIKLFAVTIIVSVIISASFGLCFLPGFIPLVYFLFAAHCVMIENPKWLAGISRTSSLVNGNWWRAFGFLWMVGLLYSILAFAITEVVTYVSAFLINALPGAGNSFGSITNVGGVSWNDQGIPSIGASIAMLLVTPFIVSVLTVFYYDLRVRNEAYDVLALARELNYKPLSELMPYLPSAVPPGSIMYTQSRPPKPPVRKGNP